MDRCAACGATLYGAAEWCGQCLAPVRTAAPNPFAPKPGARSIGEQRFVPQESAVAVAPTPWARPAEPDWAPPPPKQPSWTTSNEARLAVPLVAILLLGALVQVGLWAYAKGGAHEAAHLIRLSQWVILGFYGIVLAMVVRMARTVDFLPLWSAGSTAENAAVGALKGVATATVVLLLLSGATGRIQVAPSVKFQLGDATLVSTALALLLLTVAAPVVEELLFRGLVAESLRRHGQIIALAASGFLFALWHMRFGAVQLVYYTVLGVMLGRTYWKRGLVASIATHAGFNGTLALVALVFILGPGATMSANGITVHAPGGWDEIDTTGTPLGDAALAAHGPSGAVFYVARVPLPEGIPLQAAAAALAQNLPGVSAASSVRTTRYPAGEAVRVGVTMKGNRGEVALISTGADWWMAVVEQSTDRSRDDFEEMLESLDLSG